MVKALALIIHEKEQLVFPDRAAKVPPNMFQRRAARGRKLPGPSNLFSHWLALRTLLRKNSQTSPWNWLVPDLIEALMIPPAKLPNSAGAFDVIRLNSWMASGEGVKPNWFSEVWLLSIPSRMKLSDCSRCPSMDGRPPSRCCRHC